MSAKQLKLCERFVYIPQHGPGTASLNVTVAASIVLHHFAVWAGLPERERRQQKFVVAERPQRTVARGASTVILAEQPPGIGLRTMITNAMSEAGFARHLCCDMPLLRSDV